MKIASVETIHVRTPLSRAVGPAGASNRARAAIVVKIVADDGLVGWGETYAIAGVRAAIDEVLGPLLVGQDPRQIRRLWRRMMDATLDNGFAVGGVDIALHDLAGKALGVPISGLYGGVVRERVPVYASGLCYVDGVDPAESWMAEAADLVGRGFRAIKMRMGRFAAEVELPLVERVMGSLPAGTRLMVDAWGSYTPPTAIRVGRELQRMGLTWFEEPMPQAGYAGYEQVAAALDIAIAGGETLQTRAAFKELLERRAVDVVQPDLSICGGVGECLFVADLARLYGVGCTPHSWNGGIMNAATLHVAAMLPDGVRVPGMEAPLLEHDTTENPLVRGMLATPLELDPTDGCFAVPTGPGLGVVVDEAWLRRMEVPG